MVTGPRLPSSQVLCGAGNVPAPPPLLLPGLEHNEPHNLRLEVRLAWGMTAPGSELPLDRHSLGWAWALRPGWGPSPQEPSRG